MTRKKKTLQQPENIKQVILGYIQDKSWEIMNQYNLSDVRLEENPYRLHIVLIGKIIPEELKEIKYKDVILPVEFETDGTRIEEAKKNEESQEKEDPKYYHVFSETLGVDISEKDAKNKEAFEAWKKRHNKG